MSIFVTSDWHFGHNKEFLYKPRGFDNIQDHDEAIIKNFNEIVRPEDTVYFLGDAMLCDNQHGIECIQRLNGHFHFILGNHDTPARIELYKQLPQIESIEYATLIKHNKKFFYLSHYPTILANGGSTVPFAIHGHTHSKKQFEDNLTGFHAGLDSNNLRPVLLDFIPILFQRWENQNEEQKE